MPIFDLLNEAAESCGEKTSLIFSDRSISFGDLYLQSRQVAARLQRLGIGPGSRVAILHENALPAVVFFWGILAAGAEIVDVPCLSGTDAIEAILTESKPAAIVASSHQLQRIQRNRMPLPGTVFVDTATGEDADAGDYQFLSEIVTSEVPASVLPRVHDCSVALIIYTSGSTGRPKGVMLSHRNLLSNIASANTLLGLSSADSILVVVPLHFIHGRMQLLTHMMTHSTMAFAQSFHFPQRVVDDLARYEVSGFSGTPYHFTTLLDRTNLSSVRLPHLRYILVTGGAMHPEKLRELAAALPGVDIHLAYGQTEASPRITYLSPSEVLTRPECSGRPLPGVMVQIVNEQGSEVSPGTLGEVVSSGPNTMCGYVSGDEISSGKIDLFGRLHTGDIGRFDSDRYLYLAGRKSDLIKCAGERVFPREIESVLEMHPAVRESAVFGIPDMTLGEKIVAGVVLRPGMDVDPDALRSYCLRSLPAVRAPREIRFTQCLPKTESGKIDRKALVKLFDELRAFRAAS